MDPAPPGGLSLVIRSGGLGHQVEMGESKGMREMLAALWPKYKEKLDLSEFELDGFQTTAAEFHKADEAKYLPSGTFYCSEVVLSKLRSFFKVSTLL